MSDKKGKIMIDYSNPHSVTPAQLGFSGSNAQIDFLKKMVVNLEKGKEEKDAKLIMDTAAMLRGTNWNLVYDKLENYMTKLLLRKKFT